MGSTVEAIMQSILGPAVSNSTVNSTSFLPMLTALPGSMRNIAGNPLLMPGGAGADGLLFLVMGGLLESVRFLISSAFGSVHQVTLAGWSKFVETFIFQVRVEKDDEAFDWLMNFFGRERAYRTATSVSVSTKATYRKHQWNMDPCPCNDCSGKTKRPPKDLASRLQYVPAIGAKGGFSFVYEYSRISVTRGPDHWHDGIQIQILTFVRKGGRAVMTKMITEAKKLQDEKEAKRISVYLGRPDGKWKRAESKARRAWSSVILESGVKESLLEDANEFLGAQNYYSERGIPYRRGYLLHGVPGAGKTSLVQSLAGTLDLDIYVIPLANRGFDDGKLADLVAELPSSCIALIEDIDCAFNDQARKRDLPAKQSTKDESENDKSDVRDGVTLSGLLNAIDGVAAHEGRLLFATTNVPSTLDQALIRPGRIDLSIEFKNASQMQAEELFKCFYKPDQVVHDSKRPTLSLIVPDLLTPPTSPNSEKSGSPDSAEDEKRRALPLEERDRLAKEFSKAIPEREFSMAALQGYLLKHKETPHRCAREVSTWVQEQRLAQTLKATEDETMNKETGDEAQAEGESKMSSEREKLGGQTKSDHVKELERMRTALEDMQKALDKLQNGL